jgi:hypothetical protein
VAGAGAFDRTGGLFETGRIWGAYHPNAAPTIWCAARHVVGGVDDRAAGSQHIPGPLQGVSADEVHDEIAVADVILGALPAVSDDQVRAEIRDVCGAGVTDAVAATVGPGLFGELHGESAERTRCAVHEYRHPGPDLAGCAQCLRRGQHRSAARPPRRPRAVRVGGEQIGAHAQMVGGQLKLITSVTLRKLAAQAKPVLVAW